MYGHITYEGILERMLSRVRETVPELDTREGSLIFTALAPAAVEMQLMYIEMDTVLNESFADTQSGPYLTRRAAERGIFAKEGETTEQLRRRYMQSLGGTAFGGNAADYIQKAGALPGVGGVKVTPAWNGGGTVLLTITDTFSNRPPDSLVSEVQQAIDPKSGSGQGIAPIGHTVTVRGAEETVINIEAAFVFHSGFDWGTVRAQAEQAAAGYIGGLREGWAEEDAVIVRVSGLEQRFLAIPGILDVTDTKLNGTARNLTLGAAFLPKLGSVAHHE
ncbi:MAG: baseplate J/gp47 family protein [Oscillospiraceae bacterium]|jgi:uncharacterized phage protein gp47/JayE|nr:baseplate J/gp47 family protein [Oscillospiraceae bacterium]